jgi:hypothetical protein
MYLLIIFKATSKLFDSFGKKAGNLDERSSRKPSSAAEVSF